MKKYLLFICLFPVFYSSAQTNSEGSLVLNIRDMTGRLITNEFGETKGSPLLNDTWANGDVKFANGKIAKNIPLRFNLFSGELYFKRDEMDYTFAEPVSQFSFSYDENGKDRLVIFRNGYPGAKPVSFYEVMAERGRFQLLKRVTKSIEESYNYAAPPTKAFVQKTEIYVYDSQLMALSLVKNKQPLAEAVPELATLLAVLPGNEKGKYRSEKELVEVFQKLNP